MSRRVGFLSSPVVVNRPAPLEEIRVYLRPRRAAELMPLVRALSESQTH